MSIGRLFFLLAACALSLPARAEDEGASRFVDPFIGTTNGGNTFPGAVRPWGMVSVSPHTDLQSPSGYVHGRPWFYGLGQVHLSGTGCAELGSIVVTATANSVSGDPERVKCTLSDQRAAPGYWAGTLVEPSLRAEATATVRCGIMRFTPLRGRPWTLLIDAGRSLSLLGGGAVRWSSDRELEGYSIGGQFCGEANRHKIYFVARISRSPSSRGTWQDSSVTGNSTASAESVSLGAWARYEGGTTAMLEIRIGVSYVSVANARANLLAEADPFSFDQLRSAARAAWEQELARIRVSGGSSDDKTKLYTALYHTLIHPNIISDVNGEYPLFARPGTGRNQSREHYTVFSLWDTYRTLHPLLTLVYPERQCAMVATMLDMYTESGWLPKWELAASETHMMVGDGAVTVIADTYLKGLRAFDTTTAYAAMRKNGAVLGPESEPSRPGYAEYLRYGYIPAEVDTTQAWWVWGPVSTTLEYCLSDWAFSRVAARSGHPEDAREWARRSSFYRNLFDSASGFLRPRKADGQWLSPFDPEQRENSGNWAGSGGPGYVEGNAWNYTWFVPHDIPGLALLFGGAARCAAKLEECFTRDRFTITNEPDIAYPYLFTYFPGQERRTRMLLGDIMRREFHTGPGGLPGNDDTGTLSAWFVFSALGFYPDCPGSGQYRIGRPLFPQAAIALDGRYYRGKSITIHSSDGSDEQSDVTVRWNGRVLQNFIIDHSTMTDGGELTFTASR